jgi:hypothetical protein
VAWLCHELNDDRGATRYYAISAMAIRQADDPALDAYVQGFKSQVWYRWGDAEQALLLAENAGRKAARSGGATLAVVAVGTSRAGAGRPWRCD